MKEISAVVAAHNARVLAAGAPVEIERNPIELGVDKALNDFEIKFYPKHPPILKKNEMSKLGKRKRQERYLQSYNATAGFKTRAQKAAGVSKKTIDLWKQDDIEFQEALKSVDNWIVDRCVYLLNMKAGIVRPMPYSFLNKLDTSALLSRLKSIAPEQFGEKFSGEVTLKFDVPRPKRNNDTVQASRSTDFIPLDNG